MRDFSELFPDVQMHVSCNTNTVILLACRNAARELFERTRVWVEECQSVKERIGKNKFELTIPEGTEIVGVHSMLRGTSQLASEGVTYVSSTANDNGTPTAFHRRGTELLLNKTVVNPSEIKPFLILKPSYDSDGIASDYLADKYRDIIISGAVAKLLAMPAKLWSAPALAPQHQYKFEEGLTQVEREAKGYNDGRPNTVEYPYAVRDFVTGGRNGRGRRNGGY